jgi:dUTP pyrophosphatase
VRTGLALHLDSHKVGRFCPRSGLAGKGIDLGAGVIDSGYRGEVRILLINKSGENYCVKEGDKIAQMLLLPVYNDKVVEMDELPPSERDIKGFGSSGK